jgi:hypothetical protein
MEFKLYLSFPMEKIPQKIDFKILTELDLQEHLLEHQEAFEKWKRTNSEEKHSSLNAKNIDDYVKILFNVTSCQELIEFTFLECVSMKDAILEKKIILNDENKPYLVPHDIIMPKSIIDSARLKGTDFFRARIQYQVEKTKLMQSLL